MFVLSENFGVVEESLYKSINAIATTIQFVSLSDQPFIPKEVMTPFKYYTSQGDYDGAAIHVTQLSIPDKWMVRGDIAGVIVDKGALRGRISYYGDPIDRLVEKILWYTENGSCHKIDYYNEFGFHYSSHFLNQDGSIISKSYYTRDRKEILVENVTIGKYYLTQGNESFIFDSYDHFVIHFLHHLHLEENVIAIPSDLVVKVCQQKALKDIRWLVETEEYLDNIIGNHPTESDESFWTTSEEFLEVLKNRVKNYQLFRYLIPFVERNKNTMDVLIFTNSEDIEKINELVTLFPTMDFHIAAYTKMAPSLHNLERRNNNVHLYPNISQKIKNHLMKKCSYYFDIAHYTFFNDIILEALTNKMLMIAFHNTLTESKFVPRTQIFDHNDLISLLYFVEKTQSASIFFEQVEKQTNFLTDQEDIVLFQKLISGENNDSI